MLKVHMHTCKVTHTLQSVKPDSHPIHRFNRSATLKMSKGNNKVLTSSSGERSVGCRDGGRDVA